MKASLEQIAWKNVAKSFKDDQNLCKKITFSKGQMIVKNGVLQSQKNKHFYEAVPLTFIKNGTVAIIENGIAVKHYSKGECFGLFETACFLMYGISDRIGRWDVKATNDVELLVSTEKFVSNLPILAKNALITAARENPVGKPLSNLPLLDWFSMSHLMKPHDETIIVYHSHILYSSIDLIKHLAYIAGPRNTFILEKPYSTLPHAFGKIAEGGVQTYQMKIDPQLSYEYAIKRNIDFFWHAIQEHMQRSEQKIKKIIVISDGADVLLSPLIQTLKGVQVIGIEQTERGLLRLQHAKQRFPIVSIARSNAKKQFESPFIAASALAKIKSAGLLDKSKHVGVVGIGSIGKEIIRILNTYGITPLVYDPFIKQHDDIIQANSLEDLVQDADIIIGTTGTDCLRGMFIERLKGKKTFISTSSSNVEFDYLFDLAKTYANKFEDITLPITKHFTAKILNGGYPINFDRVKEWESLENIQLTRGLIYASVFEALNTRSSKRKITNINPKLEKEVIRKWLHLIQKLI